MVSRRELIGRILGAGASLVAMVIGSKSESQEADPTSWSFGLEKGTTKGPAFRKKVAGTADTRPRVQIWGAGERFYGFVEMLRCHGWSVETGEGWSHFDSKWQYCVFVRATLDVKLIGDWVELRDHRFRDGVDCYHADAVEKWAAQGVTMIRSGGLTIDLT